MSAGFKIAGEVFWGSNGAIEVYLDALASQAAAQFGSYDPIAVFFRSERDLFFTGAVTVLDPVLSSTLGRERFLRVLDGATEELLASDSLSEYGKSWAKAVVGNLRQRVLDGVCP